MECNLDLTKCALLKMKRENQVHCEYIDLQDGVLIEEVDEKYTSI